MAGSRRSEDAGDVPWPALVDLLTSVLITFMFFVLVTTVAMSTMTVKTAMEHAKKLEKSGKNPPEAPTGDSPETDQDSQSPTATSTTLIPSSTLQPPQTTDKMLPPPSLAQTTQPPEEMLAEAERLKKENEILKQQLTALSTSFAKSTKIGVENEVSDKALTLLFNRNEAGMLPEAHAAIARFVQQAGDKDTLRVSITAAQPDGLSFSQARERALTRAMVVRNVLLEMKIDPSRISFEYDESGTERFKSNNWVRLQIAPGARP